jgi:hypothetical protein
MRGAGGDNVGLLVASSAAAFSSDNMTTCSFPLFWLPPPVPVLGFGTTSQQPQQLLLLSAVLSLSMTIIIIVTVTIRLYYSITVDTTTYEEKTGYFAWTERVVLQSRKKSKLRVGV